MGLLGDAINSVYNAGAGLLSAGKGLVEDVSTWCSGLLGSVGSAIDSQFSGDVVGINANKIDEMINAIEDYIKKVNTHLDQIKTETDPRKAMQGEYADAVKTYVGTACDVCYKITSQLRYFEDKLVMVKEAYAQKDQNLASTINDTSSEMNSEWNEYRRTT